MSGPGLDSKATGARAFAAVAVLFVLTVLVSLLPYEHHPHFAFEEVPGFAALFGLTGCIGLVLGAVKLRSVLMRGEDHYDDE